MRTHDEHPTLTRVSATMTAGAASKKNPTFRQNGLPSEYRRDTTLLRARKQTTLFSNATPFLAIIFTQAIASCHESGSIPTEACQPEQMVRPLHENEILIRELRKNKKDPCSLPSNDRHQPAVASLPVPISRLTHLYRYSITYGRPS